MALSNNAGQQRQSREDSSAKLTVGGESHGLEDLLDLRVSQAVHSQGARQTLLEGQVLQRKPRNDRQTKSNQKATSRDEITRSRSCSTEGSSSTKMRIRLLTALVVRRVWKETYNHQEKNS